MEKILDDVRRDAITKLKMSEKNVDALAEAADTIMICSRKSRKYGLLSLEADAKDTDSEFLRFVMMMAVDACETEYLIEAATNAYWTLQPKGVWAMVDHIYLRGVSLIQEGYDTDRFIAPILQSLIPKDQRSEFNERIRSKRQHRKEIAEQYAHIQRPMLQNPELLEKIHAVEKHTQETWEWIRKISGMEADDLMACLYVLDEEVRRKIMDASSEKYWYFIMEGIARYHQTEHDEADMVKSISVMLSLCT